MNKHTPGPWVVDPDSPTDISPADDLRLGIASISYADEAGGRWLFGEQSKANANLIAAAPDLLAVARELAEAAAYWSEYDVPLGLADRLNTAIAKATEAP